MTRSRSTWHVWVAVVGWLVAAAGAPAGTIPTGDFAELHRLQELLAEVADRVRPSVVAIQSLRPATLVRRSDAPDRRHAARTPDHASEATSKLVSVGSGVIIDSDGLVLTNEHVIRGAAPGEIFCLLSNGRSCTVRDVASDPRRDLAVLRIDATGLVPARLGDVASVRQGYFVIVLGNPLGTASADHGRPAMSFGVVSALGRDLTWQLDAGADDRYYGNLIQTDAPIHPGNSGGPLLNIEGEVIGISTALSIADGTAHAVGYAIPMSDWTKRIVARLARGQEVAYGFIGVGLRPTTEEDLRFCGEADAAPPALYGGAVVTTVGLGTPAADAHLQEGDVLLEINGRRIEDVDTVIRRIGQAPIGVRLELTVCRRGYRLLVPVIPARRKTPAPNTMTWRGMTLADPDWAVCRRFKLPADVQGLVVTEIVPGGPADQAKLRVGQVVSRIGGVPVFSVRRLPWITAGLAGPIRVTTADSPSTEKILPDVPQS